MRRRCFDAQFGEECDDGNRLDDLSGCSTDCRQNNVCGDGIVQSVFEFVMTAIPTRAAIVMPIAAVLEPAIPWRINKSELLR